MPRNGKCGILSLLKKNVIYSIKRILGIVIVVTSPVILTIAIFMPVISRQRSTASAVPDNFRAEFQKENIVKLVQGMRMNGEFRFYFEILSPENIEQAIDEVYSELDQNRSSVAMKELLFSKKDQVRTKAILFNSFDYSALQSDTEDFRQESVFQPLWLFLYEDFKLTILGICYKALYDKNFSFSWEADIKQAALNLRHIIENLPEGKRLNFQEQGVPE
jgi:hypothetical protein